MRVHASVIRGPSLYRHECVKCREETLHNYLGCVHCETYPWGKPLKLGGDAQRIMKSGMRQRNW